MGRPDDVVTGPCFTIARLNDASTNFLRSKTSTYLEPGASGESRPSRDRNAPRWPSAKAVNCGVFRAIKIPENLRRERVPVDVGAFSALQPCYGLWCVIRSVWIVRNGPTFGIPVMDLLRSRWVRQAIHPSWLPITPNHWSQS